jgi:hypothetical protein
MHLRRFGRLGLGRLLGKNHAAAQNGGAQKKSEKDAKSTKGLHDKLIISRRRPPAAGFACSRLQVEAANSRRVDCVSGHGLILRKVLIL